MGIHSIVLFFLSFAPFYGFAGQKPPTFEPKPQFIDVLKERSLAYFIDHRHPQTGLIRDRAPNFKSIKSDPQYRIASIAATGFGLAVLAHASKEGRVDKKQTQLETESTLHFVENSLEHWHGWLYHFLDWETGKRIGRSEISTIDTALFLAGAYYASLVFPQSKIGEITERLHERLDFHAMRTNGGSLPDKQTLSLGYFPEEGYIPFDWDIYSEHLILYFLGLGHPTKPLPTTSWKAWRRARGIGPLWKDIWGGGLPLFIHQYNFSYLPTHLPAFVEFDFFSNSKKATLRDKQTCALAKAQYKTYEKGFWGLSASQSSIGYEAFSPQHHNGTVCPGCVGASAPFEPTVLEELEAWTKTEYSPQIWGQYGFVDAFNLHPLWFSREVIGITVGALYLAVANLQEHGPWADYGSLAFVKRAIQRIDSPPDREWMVSTEIQP